MDYTVIVKTGDRFLSGTDSTVRIVLHGDSGNSTQPRVLDNVFRDDFEQGAIDKFSIRDEDVGDIAWVEVWRDDFGVAADWFVETIIVERKGKLFHFPFLRWVKAHTNYRIQHLDTSLPQDDKFLEQRNALLEEKRKLYDYSVKGPGLPVQVNLLISRRTRECSKIYLPLFTICNCDVFCNFHLLELNIMILEMHNSRILEYISRGLIYGSYVFNNSNNSHNRVVGSYNSCFPTFLRLTKK